MHRQQSTVPVRPFKSVPQYSCDYRIASVKVPMNIAVHRFFTLSPADEGYPEAYRRRVTKAIPLKRHARSTSPHTTIQDIHSFRPYLPSFPYSTHSCAFHSKSASFFSTTCALFTALTNKQLHSPQQFMDSWAQKVGVFSACRIPDQNVQSPTKHKKSITTKRTHHVIR
jgi:hypothetical protein